MLPTDDPARVPPARAPTDLEKSMYAQVVGSLDQAWADQFRSFDQAVLTLSTAALGLSLAFLSDVLEGGQVVSLSLLRWSWWLFGLAILSTLLSFVASRFAIGRQRELARRYLLEDDRAALSASNCGSVVTGALNALSGTAFIIGVVLTILFVSLNLGGS